MQSPCILYLHLQPVQLVIQSVPIWVILVPEKNKSWHLVFTRINKIKDSECFASSQHYEESISSALLVCFQYVCLCFGKVSECAHVCACACTCARPHPHTYSGMFIKITGREAKESLESTHRKGQTTFHNIDSKYISIFCIFYQYTIKAFSIHGFYTICLFNIGKSSHLYYKYLSSTLTEIRYSWINMRDYHRWSN